LPFKQPLPAEHLVKHYAEGPDVSALVHRPAFRLLWRHVCCCAENHARNRGTDQSRRIGKTGRLLLLKCLRQTEIEDLHRSVRSQLDIGRFQVSMDNSALVSRFESIADVLCNVESFHNGNGTALNALRECFALSQFENEKACRTDFLEIIDCRYVRMI